MIHDLLLELVGLLNILALTLHQVNYFGWIDQGYHSWYRTTLLLKVAHVILASAQGPNPSFSFFGGTFIRLWGLLGQGLGLRLGPGLDNNIIGVGV